LLLPTLIDGRILRRYKRFLAEVELADGSLVTAHVPNTGRMSSCWSPGAPAQLSSSDNPRRKLAWTLERVDMGAGWVGVHTGRTNAVMAEGIVEGRIASLAGYRELRREVELAPIGHPKGRLDIALTKGPAPDVLIEVKNVTLLDGNWLRFPDAVSERGRKHLGLLQAAVEQGNRGVMLYAVNRPEGECFVPAWAIDTAYAGRLAAAAQAGVEVLAVRIRHTETQLEVGEELPVDLTMPNLQ